MWTKPAQSREQLDPAPTAHHWTKPRRRVRHRAAPRLQRNQRWQMKSPPKAGGSRGALCRLLAQRARVACEGIARAPRCRRKTLSRAAARAPADRTGKSEIRRPGPSRLSESTVRRRVGVALVNDEKCSARFSACSRIMLISLLTHTTHSLHDNLCVKRETDACRRARRWRRTSSSTRLFDRYDYGRCWRRRCRSCRRCRRRRWG